MTRGAGGVGAQAPAAALTRGSPGTLLQAAPPTGSLRRLGPAWNYRAFRSGRAGPDFPFPRCFQALTLLGVWLCPSSADSELGSLSQSV